MSDSDRDLNVYLTDILESIKGIEKYTEKKKLTFIAEIVNLFDNEDGYLVKLIITN